MSPGITALNVAVASRCPAIRKPELLYDATSPGGSSCGLGHSGVLGFEERHRGGQFLIRGLAGGDGLVELGLKLSDGGLGGGLIVRGELDVSVLSSASEGLSNTLLESMAGHGGGWSLARDPAHISLGEVCSALGERLLFAVDLALQSGCQVQGAVSGVLDGFLRDAEALLLERLGVLALPLAGSAQREPPLRGTGVATVLLMRFWPDSPDTRVLVDTTPELRLQCVAHSVDRIEGVVFTHAHADHLSGAPYIKARTGAKIGIGEHIKDVQKIFRPIFNATDLDTEGKDFDHLFRDGERFKIGELDVDGSLLDADGCGSFHGDGSSLRKDLRSLRSQGGLSGRHHPFSAVASRRNFRHAQPEP